jgi:hypothetical protein
MPLAEDVIEGPTFALTKQWVDPSPGIELVEVHYVWGPPGEPPDWERDQTAVATPVDPGPPARRAAALELPRFVDGATDYLLHHFFFVAGGGAQASTPVFTEQIGAREVRYDDPENRYTNVGVAWTVGDSRDPNYSVAALDGLDFAGAGDQTRPETLTPIFEFVQAVPPPHVFRGRVWGVKGQPVTHVFHLVRLGSPAGDDAERWDDNDGRGWQLTI